MLAPSNTQTARAFIEHTYPTDWHQIECVRGWDGTIYPRLPFQSELEANITLTLQDTQKSKRVWKSYQAHLQPLLANTEASGIFNRWLIKHICLLTCKKQIHLNALLKKTALISFKTHLDTFLSSLACQEHSHPMSSSRMRRIAIVMVSGAGGELMVSKALEVFLTNQSFEVRCFDVQQLEREQDPLYRFSGGMHREDIWGEIYQKVSTKLAEHYWWVADAVKRFIPDNSLGILKTHIAAFKPDCILSTRTFFHQDVTLAYDLGIPLRFINCDYHFNPALLPMLKRVDAQLVKFWVPSIECLSHMDVKTHRFHTKIEVVGYPIRSGIQKVKDPFRLLAIRKKWNIRPEEKVLFMMMGKQGMSTKLRELVALLNTTTKICEPLHVAVVCGNNGTLKEAIESDLTQASLSKHIRFKIYGYLEEELISDFYNFTKVFTGKAGGSTSAELILMEILCIVFPSTDIEIPNVNHLVHLGLGTALQDTQAFIDTLIQLLNKEQAPSLSQVDWQAQVLKSLS